MKTIQVTEEELKLLREACAGAVMHNQKLVEGLKTILSGKGAVAFAREYGQRADKFAALHVRLLEMT